MDASYVFDAKIDLVAQSLLQISASDADKTFDSFLCLLNMFEFSPLPIKVGLFTFFLNFLLLRLNPNESICLWNFGLCNLKLVNHMDVFDSGLKALFFFDVFRTLTVIAFKADKVWIATTA